MAISTGSGFQVNYCFCALAPGRNSQYSGQSVRALPTRIITVGKKRLPGVQLLVDEYIGKLKFHSSIDDIQIRSNPKNARDSKAQIDDEDLAVMKLVTSDDWWSFTCRLCCWMSVDGISGLNRWLSWLQMLEKPELQGCHSVSVVLMVMAKE